MRIELIFESADWRESKHSQRQMLNRKRTGIKAMLSRLKALQILSKCRGDEIWPIELCQSEGVPSDWISELADATESGFESDLDTLYMDKGVVNQFHGVQDLRLAFKLGEFLGADTSEIAFHAFGRIAKVNAIREAVEEL